MVPLLPALAAGLLQVVEKTEGTHPLEAATALWTLGRLASWIVRAPETGLLERLGRACAGRVTGASRTAANAALSCLGVLGDESWAVSKRTASHNGLLAPLLPGVLQTYVEVLPRAQGKTLLVLCDSLHSLLQGLGSNMELRTAVAQLLLPALIRVHSQVPADRRRLVLLECFTGVVLAVGPPAAAHLSAMLPGSLQAAQAQLQAFALRESQEMAVLAELRLRRPEAGAGESRDVVLEALGGEAEYDLDPVVAGLDLCGAAVEALGSEEAERLLGGAGDALRGLLGAALQCRK